MVLSGFQVSSEIFFPFDPTQREGTVQNASPMAAGQTNGTAFYRHIGSIEK